MTEEGGGVPGALTGLLEQLARVPRRRLPAEHVEALCPGASVGRFVVQRELGRGGFGTVYAALDTALGRLVALKVLHPGAGSAAAHPERLRLEAEAVARLHHPGIVTVFDVGRTEEAAFLVFELLSGETLASRLRRGRLPSREALRVGLAVAEALAHAHAARVLHLDLKPANVFLCDGGAVKVLDFGLARLFGQASAASGGTPGYMAPELGREQGGDERSDLFSLGVLLHAMTGGEVVGRTPAGSDQAAGPRLAGGSGPRALRALVADLTRPVPEERPTAIEPVRARLEAMLGSRRRRLVALGAFGAAALLMAAARAMRPGAGGVARLERLHLVLADAGNASGQPELDHLPELARIALDDSRRVGLVAPGRLAAAAREAGRPVGERPDAAALRAAAPLVGADGLLLLGAGRDGSGYRLSLRAEAPLGTVRLEQQVTAPSLQGVPQALDALLRAMRAALQEPPADLAASGTPVAELATPSLAAFAAYAEGLECEQEEQAVTGGDLFTRCSRSYRRALTADPSFALAHHRLAQLLAVKPHAAEEARGHLEAALARRDRLSRRDAAMLQAFRDHLDGRDDLALRSYSELLAAAPDDVPVLRVAGKLAYDRGQYATAAPYLARTMALQPRSAWACDLLVTSYALAGASVELRGLGERLASSPDWASRRAAVHAFAWLGDHARSVELARAAAADLPKDTERWFLAASALAAAGRFEEAEPLVEALVAAEPGSIHGYLNQVTVARSRGKVLRSWSLAERPPSSASRSLAPAEQAYLKALLAAGDGDLSRLVIETRKVYAGAPELGTACVVLVALQAPGQEADEFPGSLPPGSTGAAEVEALRAWKAGRASEAVAALTAIERRDPWPDVTIAPSYLLAEVALASDPAEALAAAERFRTQWPRGTWRAWAYPRSLLISASASLRLGDRAGGAAYLDRLEEIMKDADHGLALLREARGLRRRLAEAPAGH